MKLTVSVVCALVLVLSVAHQAQAQRASASQRAFGAKMSGPAPVIRDHRGSAGKLHCTGGPCPPRGSEHKVQGAGERHTRFCRIYHGRHPRCY